MGHDSRARATGSSTSGLFVEFHATLICHLYALLSFEKILRMAAKERAIDSNLLALVVHPFDRLVGVESHVAPMQAWELFVVIEVTFTLDHSGELLGLTFPLNGHDAFDKAGAARNEGFNKVLNFPFAWKGLGGEVARGECATEASGFVEVDIVEARERGAIAKAVLALVLVAAFAGC